MVPLTPRLPWRCRWLRYTPFKLFWDPRLAFTGITILGYNGETGEQMQLARACVLQSVVPLLFF